MIVCNDMCRANISEIGNALVGFQSLTRLDLSRNDLEFIDGIEFAEMLTDLSLYYNRINSLEALDPLSKLSRLASLDLRLNPVVRDQLYRR